jgi:type IV secretion system protein VirD4
VKKLLKASARLFNPAVPSADAVGGFFGALGLSRSGAAGPAVRVPQAVHTLIAGPSRAGKGIYFVIPELLRNPHSMVVFDPKGENYLATAERRRKMGQKVVALDPFRLVTREPDTLNPVDHLDRYAPETIAEIVDIAEAMVVKNPQAKEPHWDESAELWAAGMLMQVVLHAVPPHRSLQGVRTLLTDPALMEKGMEMLCRTGAWGGVASRFGHQLKQFQERELASVLTSANRHLRFLDLPEVVRSTGTSSFDPMGLKRGAGMTVYLVIPPEHLRPLKGLVRLWLSVLLRAVVKSGLGEERLVHFVLDEAATLERMPQLLDALNQYAGYGCRLMFIYQNTAQLKTCWPEGQDATVLAGCTKVFFAVSELETATFVSNCLGEETILVPEYSENASTTRQLPDYSERGSAGSTSYSTSTNVSVRQMGSKLLRPEQVLTLPRHVAVTLAPGLNPVLTALTPYFRDPEFVGGPQAAAVARRGGVPLKAVAVSFLLAPLAGLLALVCFAVVNESRRPDWPPAYPPPYYQPPPTPPQPEIRLDRPPPWGEWKPPGKEGPPPWPPLPPGYQTPGAPPPAYPRK